MDYRNYISQIYHFFDKYIGSEEGSRLGKHYDTLNKYGLISKDIIVVRMSYDKFINNNLQKTFDDYIDWIRMQKTKKILYIFSTNDHAMSFTLEIKYNYILFTYINSGYGINYSSDIKLDELYNLWDTHYIKIIADPFLESEQVIYNIALSLFFMNIVSNKEDSEVFYSILSQIPDFAKKIDDLMPYTKQEQKYQKIWEKIISDKIYDTNDKSHTDDIILIYLIKELLFPDKSHTKNLDDNKRKIIQEKNDIYNKFIIEWTENITNMKNSTDVEKKIVSYMYNNYKFTHVNGKLYTDIQKSGSCAWFSLFWGLFHIILFTSGDVISWLNKLNVQFYDDIKKFVYETKYKNLYVYQRIRDMIYTTKFIDDPELYSLNKYLNNEIKYVDIQKHHINIKNNDSIDLKILNDHIIECRTIKTILGDLLKYCREIIYNRKNNNKYRKNKEYESYKTQIYNTMKEYMFVYTKTISNIKNNNLYYSILNGILWKLYLSYFFIIILITYSNNNQITDICFNEKTYIYYNIQEIISDLLDFTFDETIRINIVMQKCLDGNKLNIDDDRLKKIKKFFNFAQKNTDAFTRDFFDKYLVDIDDNMDEIKITSFRKNNKINKSRDNNNKKNDKITMKNRQHHEEYTQFTDNIQEFKYVYEDFIIDKIKANSSDEIKNYLYLYDEDPSYLFHKKKYLNDTIENFADINYIHTNELDINNLLNMIYNTSIDNNNSDDEIYMYSYSCEAILKIYGIIKQDKINIDENIIYLIKSDEEIISSINYIKNISKDFEEFKKNINKIKAYFLDLKKTNELISINDYISILNINPYFNETIIIDQIKYFNVILNDKKKIHELENYGYKKEDTILVNEDITSIIYIIKEHTQPRYNHYVILKINDNKKIEHVYFDGDEVIFDKTINEYPFLIFAPLIGTTFILKKNNKYEMIFICNTYFDNHSPAKLFKYINYAAVIKLPVKDNLLSIDIDNINLRELNKVYSNFGCNPIIYPNFKKEINNGAYLYEKNINIFYKDVQIEEYIKDALFDISDINGKNIEVTYFDDVRNIMKELYKSYTNVDFDDHNFNNKVDLQNFVKKHPICNFDCDVIRVIDKEKFDIIIRKYETEIKKNISRLNLRLNNITEIIIKNINYFIEIIKFNSIIKNLTNLYNLLQKCESKKTCQDLSEIASYMNFASHDNNTIYKLFIECIFCNIMTDEQSKKIDNIIESYEKNRISDIKIFNIHHFMMGKGKSSVITPFLVLFLNLKGHMVKIVTPQSLVNQMELTMNKYKILYGLKYEILTDSSAKNELLSDKNEMRKYVYIFDEFDMMFDPLQSNFNIVNNSIDWLNNEIYEIIYQYILSKNIINITNNNKKIKYDKNYNLIFTEIDNTLQMKNIVNITFGMSKMDNYRYVIPYARKDTPVEKSKFSSIITTLVLTFLYFMSKKSHDINDVCCLEETDLLILKNKKDTFIKSFIDYYYYTEKDFLSKVKNIQEKLTIEEKMDNIYIYKKLCDKRFKIIN